MGNHAAFDCRAFACCAGDTWASELGVLSRSKPFLVTRPWQTVRPGTNGGISLLGTMASLGGGAFVGVAFAATDACLGMYTSYSAFDLGLQSVQLTVIAMIAAMAGSLLDSFVGATMQATFVDQDDGKVLHGRGTAGAVNVGGLDIFSNEAVNLISVACTMAVTGFLSCYVLA